MAANTVLANTGIPMLLVAGFPLLLTFVPIVLVEAAVFWWKAGTRWWRSVGVMTVANLVSTFVGVPITWFALGSV